MRPFHPPRPNAGHSHGPRPGDPGPSPLHGVPMHQQMNPAAFPPPGTGFGAANPMAAVAVANPFLAMQLFGQAQQLQNLGYLAAAALQQQQQHQHPFFPGGFPSNPNQFGSFPRPHAGFNGDGTFRPGGAGSRPPGPMMSAPGNGCNNSGGGVGAPRPMLNVDGKDRNGSGGRCGEVNHTNNKSDGISHVASENGERNSTTEQKSQFNPGADGRQFCPSGGRGRGDGRSGRQFSPSCGRGRGDGRDGRQFGPTGGRQFGPIGGRGRGNGRGGRQFSPSGGRGRGRSFNQGRGRGSNNWTEVKSNITTCDSPTSGGHHIDSPASAGRRKPHPIFYDTNEVKQWVLARKKNYPTSVNINKKLSQSQSDSQKKDEEAQMRRQELKEVLAKQKELGFELPELPPGYLSDTDGKPKEPRASDRKCNWKTQHRDGRFGNGAKKRKRYDRKDFQSKRPMAWNNTRRDDGAMVKSGEPTLLQKLLSSDIKRDRHRLLHTFKFMVLNNFFRDWPDKPLEFPIVKVNQSEVETDIAAEDLDDLQNVETIKGSNADSGENGDEQASSSSDGEAGSKDDSEGEADEEDDESVSNEDADTEHNASEEEFSA